MITLPKWEALIKLITIVHLIYLLEKPLSGEESYSTGVWKFLW